MASWSFNRGKIIRSEETPHIPKKHAVRLCHTEGVQKLVYCWLLAQNMYGTLFLRFSAFGEGTWQIKRHSFEDGMKVPRPFADGGFPRGNEAVRRRRRKLSRRLPSLLTWHLTGGPLMRKLIFQVPFHKCYVSGRKGSQRQHSCHFFLGKVPVRPAKS